MLNNQTLRYVYKMISHNALSCVIDITGLRMKPAYDILTNFINSVIPTKLTTINTLVQIISWLLLWIFIVIHNVYMIHDVLLGIHAQFAKEFNKIFLKFWVLINFELILVFA